MPVEQTLMGAGTVVRWTAMDNTEVLVSNCDWLELSEILYQLANR